MTRSTPLSALIPSGLPETPYRLAGVDLSKLLRQVAAKEISLEQAEAQLRAANRLSVRVLRTAVIAVVGLVWLGIGLFLLRYAWRTHADALAFAGHSQETTGTVVALNRHDLRNSRPTYAPVFTYRLAGHTYRVTSEQATAPASYSVGESVPVRYNPARPEAGRLSSFTDRWLLVLLAAGVGGLLTLTGLFVITRVLPKPGSPVGPTPTRFRALATGQVTVDEARAQLLPDRAAARARRSPAGRAVVVLLVGMALFFSLRQLGQSVWLLVNGARADGVVVSYVHAKGSGAAPLVRYRVAGQSYDCVGDYDTSPTNRVGTVVPVLYDPARPAEAKVSSLGVLVSGPLFGLLIISAFIGLLLYSRTLRSGT